MRAGSACLPRSAATSCSVSSTIAAQKPATAASAKCSKKPRPVRARSLERKRHRSGGITGAFSRRALSEVLMCFDSDSGCVRVTLAGLTGTKRSRELQIRVQPASHLDRGVARTNRAFPLAPGGEHRHVLAKEDAESLQKAVINANQPQPAAMRLEIGRQIVQPG